MRRGYIILGLCLPLVLAISVRIADLGEEAQPTLGVTWQAPFKTVATLSGCNGTLAADSRDYTAVDAVADTSVAIWQVPAGVNRARFRFQIDADANTATVEGWTAAWRYDPGSGSSRDQMDRFTLGWSWAITGGAQTGPNSNVFVDTGVTTETWSVPGLPSDSGGDRIWQYEVDLAGVAFVAFTRSDTDANLTVYVDERHF